VQQLVAQKQKQKQKLPESGHVSAASAPLGAQDAAERARRLTLTSDQVRRLLDALRKRPS
jgi:hypothetical protein